MNKIFSKIYIKIFSFIPLSLNNFLAKLFKKFHNLHLYSSYEKDFLCNLDILNTNFKLWLLGKDIQAQSVYKKLHNTSDIYELQLVRIIKSIIETEKYTSFLDIGAFMGYFSCYIGKKNKNVKVYAIESNYNYCEFIKKSLNENKINNVKTFNEILSNNQRDMFFYKEGVYFENKYNFKEFKKKQSITLDNLCMQNSIIPEIMKIDVHGAEGLVLNGSQNILKNHCKIILLELHSDFYINKFSNGENRLSVINLLLNNNFSCYLVSNFRNSQKQKNNIVKQDPIKKIEINKDNLNSMLFDRGNLDQLIIASKNDININFLNCFKL